MTWAELDRDDRLEFTTDAGELTMREVFQRHDAQRCDGKACAAPADVCAPGWHVCAHDGNSGDLEELSSAMRRALLLASLILACAHTRSQNLVPAVTLDFTSVTDRVLDRQLGSHPQRGVELGAHEYDGRLPDVSPAGIEALRAQIAEDLAALGRVDLTKLDARHQVELSALVAAVLVDRFDVEVLRAPWRNPMFYLGPLDLTAYISRDYAPLDVRAAAIAKIAEASAAYIDHAKARLEPKIARTFLATGLLQARGMAEFVRTDVRTAIRGVKDPALAARCETGLVAMAAALDEYARHLDELRLHATDDFALGRDAFTQMLRETQGIDVDLDRLTALLEADLARNLAALDATAKQIDPSVSTAQVVARVGETRPADALATATERSARMREFLLAKQLVTIPSDDVVRVVESPPFLRWNPAFLGAAGPFETTPLPSFYYISPPDPSWPLAQQREYVPPVGDLLFITIHEVWPGHFLHGLHLAKHPSRVLRSTYNYTMSEGWAHYAEEMMWDAGVDDDPRVHIGQLRLALVRNVRALAAIGLHTQGWDVERARQMFRIAAFQDEVNASQQAMRGTFDPMYLAYTVGKLAIVKLRDDLKAKRGAAFDLRELHDELLSYGAAPLGAIRRAMLGDASPVL